MAKKYPGMYSWWKIPQLTSAAVLLRTPTRQATTTNYDEIVTEL